MPHPHRFLYGLEGWRGEAAGVGVACLQDMVNLTRMRQQILHPRRDGGERGNRHIGQGLLEHGETPPFLRPPHNLPQGCKGLVYCGVVVFVLRQESL